MPSNARPRPAASKGTSKPTAAKSTINNGLTKGMDFTMQPSNNPYAQLDQSNHNRSSSPASQAVNSEAPTMNGFSTSLPSDAAPSVNRKKQKRREKQAARLAAEQQSSAASSRPAQPAAKGAHQAFAYGHAEAPTTLNGFDYPGSEYDDADPYEPAEGEDLYYTDDDGHLYERSFGAPPNGFLPHPPVPQQSLGRKSKKKSKSGNELPKQPFLNREGYRYHPPPPPPPPLQMPGTGPAHHLSKDRIWNTSTAEERVRIKEFWLSLGEEDRRSLVKVEKEAVLKKMKEQQKHSCSCTVCGRKRTAIEEELEVLYDAYYEELEQYANHQQISLVDGTPMMPTAGLHHAMPRFPPNRNLPPINYQRASRGRIQEISQDDEEMEDEEYSEEDEDEDFSDDEPEEEPIEPKASDFFNFGNSLTVQGGILTVADDLLKNDGKKFIEMMEQLAERRMQREEDAQYAAAAGLSHPAMQPHNHGPPLEDDAYDEEDDEDSYESGDEEDLEDEGLETMTEEQRMEEGRRMFQIFAARMFEQRVLTAYREKVAAERQQKLIEELEEESRLDTQREAKKAKEAQKKKDKKRQLKVKQDEEKAQREAKKAAEEAAARAVEERKLEEQRQKKEEHRRKKEAEKKTQDEERLRREAEKQKRLQEAREQQAEQERKQREQKERERKKKEEAKKKEREDREAKEKAAAEQKEREVAEKREQEAQRMADRNSKEEARKAEQATKSASIANPTIATEIPNPKATRPQVQTRSSHASPHLQIATPAVPKAPTPFRPRQPSLQDSRVSSPKTSKAASTCSTTSPGTPGVSQSNAGATVSKPTQPIPQQSNQTSLYHPPSSSSMAIPQPPGLPPMPPIGGNGYLPNFSPMMTASNQRAPLQDPSFGHQAPLASPQHRHFMPPPTGLPFPPGINGMRQLPLGTQGPAPQPPIGQPTNSAHYVISRDTMPSHSRTHSRQTSTSYETSAFETPSIPAMTQPIARPAPIQRPSSVNPHQQGGKGETGRSDMDDLADHLGSSALLDDTDVPLTSAGKNHLRRGSVALGAPFRQGFGASPMFPDPMGAGKMENFQRGGQGGNGTHWGAPPMPFGAPPMAGSPQWAHAPGPGWANNNAFGIIGSASRPNASRAVTIRLLVCQACNKLTASQPSSHRSGFHPVDAVLRQVHMMKPSSEGAISLQEMLDICDTEGNNQNGGGSFTTENQEDAGVFVKFESGRNPSISMRGAPGDIGSPIQGSAFAGFAGPRPFQQAGGTHAPSGF
ncbi:MAG: hypothetical protein Q9186_003160 [Xanthomendoza sp. 1 TL-2023]